ncbi:synaptic vesicle glycoprotein 2B-like [Teleopsis dalmanni]|uniref:synaptic vesicle glycoprotein 2B-like n=1 Tax=Teleopsis dalmanni TaxID=139649 RepID=UPI0018CE3F31|nr:synaptic vesicle glycoprotein 2B-like [Teleopsis dalmanni]
MDWTLHITDDFDFRPWRILILFNLLPGFIASLVLTQLPESPKMLLALSKEEEALNAINWICRRNTGRPLSDLKVFHLKTESQPIQENVLIISKSALTAFKKMWRETKPLFKRPHVLNFIISCVVMCGVFLSSTGMGLWYPEIQNRVGGTNEKLTVCKVIDASIEKKSKIGNETLCDDTINTKSYIDSITYGLTYVAGYIILGIIINPIGRKGVMIGALCLSGLCGIALNWLVQPISIVVVFCLFLMLPGLCISVLSGAVVDLVPTHLRGKAVCICLMLGRSGSVIGSNIIGALLESYCDLTFSLFTGCVLLCAALTLVLPI